MLEIILILIVLAADQASKYLTELYLSPVGTSVPLWKDVFHLTYTQNRGAAWGLMQGRRTFFIVITVIVCFALIVFLFKYHKKMHVLSRVSLVLVLSGAIGNLIDRIFLSYVRDMFDFCLIQFPVFNIADSALTIGSILLVIDVLFLKERSIFALFDPPEQGGEVQTPPTLEADGSIAESQEDLTATAESGAEEPAKSHAHDA